MGFTLLELLAVITIIAILAALLIPNVKSMQDRANGAKCSQRLKVLIQSTLLYVQDNDGCLPAALNAQNNLEGISVLNPYLGNRPKTQASSGDNVLPQWKSIWWCPGTPKATPDWVITTYGINMLLCGYNPPTINYPRHKVAGIDRPSKTAVFSCQCLNYITFSWYAFQNTPQAPTGQLADWHSGGCNIAFLDGHVMQNVIIKPNDPRYRWWNVNDPLAP